MIVDKIKWHLLRIISGDQIHEYRNSTLCSNIINTLNEKSGNPQAVSIGQYYASNKLRLFEAQLSERGVQVIGDGTQIKTYSETGY